MELQLRNDNSVFHGFEQVYNSGISLILGMSHTFASGTSADQLQKQFLCCFLVYLGSFYAQKQLETFLAQKIDLS